MVDTSTLREGDKILVEMTVRHTTREGDLVYAYFGNESYSPRSVRTEDVKQITSYNFRTGDRVAMEFGVNSIVVGIVAFADSACVVIKDENGFPLMGNPRECQRIANKENETNVTG